MNKDKLARLQAQVRTGGKGSVRRKKKAVHKTTTTGALSRIAGPSSPEPELTLLPPPDR
jgi:hypothetical protein